MSVRATPSRRASYRSPGPLEGIFGEKEAANKVFHNTHSATPRKSPSVRRTPSRHSPSHHTPRRTPSRASKALTPVHNPARVMTQHDRVVHARESVLSFDVASLFNDSVLWLYVFLTLIVLVVVFVIVRNNNVNLCSWARVGILFQNQYLLAVVFSVSLILAAHSTYLGHQASGRLWQNTLVSAFLVVGVAAAVLAYLVYRAHAFSGAFWLSLVLFLGTIVHGYLVWRVHALAGYECLPLVFFFLITTYYLYFMSEEAAEPSDCLPVYAVPTP